MIGRLIGYVRENWAIARAGFDLDTEILRNLPPASSPGVSITEICARIGREWSEVFERIGYLIDKGWIRCAPATVPDPYNAGVYWDGFYIIDAGVRQLGLRDRA